jgi:hypothetical protein
MPSKQTAGAAHVGDWIKAGGWHGQPPRRGEIVELLGNDEHEHFRVRWDEEHEYPDDGVAIMPRRQRARHARH